MLFYVEMGVAFTNQYGDINEPFYASMEVVYDDALKFILLHGLREQYNKRCRKIVSDTNSIGWGFHDGLSDMYHDVFDT